VAYSAKYRRVFMKGIPLLNIEQSMEVDNRYTLLNIASKVRSKREVYTILTTEGGLFLLPMKDST